MGICCGVDMVEIQRIKDSIDKFGESFLRRVFTQSEINYCESKKNAGMKAMPPVLQRRRLFRKHLGPVLPKVFH